MPAIIATPALLSEARLAYHALMTGTSARVVVDQNGERVEFTAANKQNLYNYILELEGQLSGPTVANPMAQHYPATFLF
jgi:hypothetical protein